MAFVLFLIGGLAGVVAMLTSIVLFDASIFSALAIWFATGMTISLTGVALALIPRGEARTGDFVEA